MSHQPVRGTAKDDWSEYIQPWRRLTHATILRQILKSFVN